MNKIHQTTGPAQTTEQANKPGASTTPKADPKSPSEGIPPSVPGKDKTGTPAAK